MLFLKGAINNESVSLEPPFSIEIHFCSKLSPNSVQLSATFLTIHIKCEQDWPTRLCDIELIKSDYSRAIMHFMLLKYQSRPITLLQIHENRPVKFHPRSCQYKYIYKVGEIPSICSHDIEWKRNSDITQGP